MDIFDNKKLWFLAYDNMAGERGINQAAIIEETGLSNGYVSATFGKNRKGTISDKAMDKVSKMFALTTDEMIELGKELAGVKQKESDSENVDLVALVSEFMSSYRKQKDDLRTWNSIF